ncbi:glycosyltransferase family 1 protein [Bizionia argentinensis JUB59]|uniref:Glycosyltransferase family 1 protein n=1 Tax=Bizionia argentinensis JUB59 TaxID=1046627 RepID=G2EG75_9FLAO|nr:glycosyltransferase [Bizionia argentinensis]EGV42623.1 glycosyltransferase family 1 protein [Bizionia argentinensis JUB59]
MNILLLGEYSRLHNSLKEGLEAMGMTVTIAGFGDDFKNYPVDVLFKNSFNTGVPLFIKKILYKLSGIDLTSLSTEAQFNKHKNKLINYDVVQLINENTFNTVPRTEMRLLNYIFNNNDNVFLLTCGTDYISVNYAFEDKFQYSIFTPHAQQKVSKQNYWHVLKWRTASYAKLHDYIFKYVKGVIASDLDYHLPMLGHKLYLGLIPNPINSNKLKYISPNPVNKIVIFHGINEQSYYKKGNDLFNEALKIVKLKYASKIKIIEARSLPYSEYIESYNSAHILLDQVYAYDQGYNALEAMAKGKVVFTGAEQEWLDYYNIQEDTIAINALPDAKKIAEKLEWLILNPEKILEIAQNAREFIEREHHHITIAKQYLKTWKSYSLES